MKKKITKFQIENAYEIARRVHENKITPIDGKHILENNYGLNPNSAQDFIYNYRYLMRGETFTRTLSSTAMEYFLTRIKADQGIASLELALTALWGHIHYLEEVRRKKSKKTDGGMLISMRKIANQHMSISSEPKSLTEAELQFYIAVEKSFNDSSDSRNRRLKNASKLPRKIQVSAEIFLRNPDVVVEVLKRAKGLCEQCNKSAPFNRKSNGSPYLEVHHKLQLAKGGEDSVENAIALCPNCHRQFHFGGTFNL